MLGNLRNIVRSSNPPLPGTASYDPIWYSQGGATLGGIGVGLTNPSERLALGLPELFRAVQLKSETQSLLPLHVYDPNGELVTPTPVLIDQPNPLEARHTTIARMITSMIFYGESINILGHIDVPADHDFFAVPVSITPVHPRSVQIVDVRDKNGMRTDFYYKIGAVEYGRDQILRISSGIILPGQDWAISRLAVAAGVIDMGVQQVEFARKSFREGGVPPGVIKINRKLSELGPGELDAIQDGWAASMGNSSRRPPAVPADVDFLPIGFDMEAQQLIAARQFSLTEIANLIGVPVTFLGGGIAGKSDVMYSNVGMQNINLLQFSFYEMQQIEIGFSGLLPAGYSAKFNIAALMRMDPSGQMANLVAGITAGIYTAPEARDFLDLPPVPEDGDLGSDDEAPIPEKAEV